MDIERIRPVYFSPTGTSKAVIDAIAKGIGTEPTEIVDITRPAVRAQPFDLAPGDLLVIGVPVYMGRIPALLNDWLQALQAHGAPAVCVVVYGNRAFEDSLLELSDAVTRQGGVPIACGAFIGEHSFSAPDTPTAHGRPDADDSDNAIRFGKAVRDKLNKLSSLTDMPALTVPGNRPYGGRTELWDVDFIEVSDDCGQCGQCARVCPVEAIAPDDSRAIDIKKCITCCACIKQCPQEARSMKDGPVMDARNRLNNLFSEPQSPEWFL